MMREREKENMGGCARQEANERVGEPPSAFLTAPGREMPTEGFGS